MQEVNKSALLHQYRKADYDEEIRQYINERNQEPRESLDYFYANIRDIASRLD